MKWTPWIKFTGTTRPEGLDLHRRMQVVYLDHFEKQPQLETNTHRTVGSHVWDADTLAYRLEITRENYAIYGRFGTGFGRVNDVSFNTHKITYEIQDGEVISCKMEKL